MDIGFSNLPNQIHRKSIKRGFGLTVLVVGESGLGKSSCISSLFQAEIYPEGKAHSDPAHIPQKVEIDATSVEVDENGIKLRLTVVDTPGFGDGLDCTNCYQPIVEYIDQQFAKYLRDESGLDRRNIADSRIHCCLYFLTPTGTGLKKLDVAFMRAVHQKVNLIPVIAKQDTLTRVELMKQKELVRKNLADNHIQIYTIPNEEQEDDDTVRQQIKEMREAVPFAITGINRSYGWGSVDIQNSEHCDFKLLRRMLLTYLPDLQDATNNIHYENFRQGRLEEQMKEKDKDMLLAEREAEVRRLKQQLAALQ